MKEITSEQFRNAVAELNDVPEDIAHLTGKIDVRPDYVGRGTYGAACVGVVGKSYGDATDFMITIAEHMSPDDTDDQKVIISEMAHDMLTDGMGTSTIFYFPGWQVVD